MEKEGETGPVLWGRERERDADENPNGNDKRPV